MSVTSATHVVDVYILPIVPSYSNTDYSISSGPALRWLAIRMFPQDWIRWVNVDIDTIRTAYHSHLSEKWLVVSHFSAQAFVIRYRRVRSSKRRRSLKTSTYSYLPLHRFYVGEKRRGERRWWLLRKRRGSSVALTL